MPTVRFRRSPETPRLRAIKREGPELFLIGQNLLSQQRAVLLQEGMASAPSHLFLYSRRAA